MSGRRPHLNPMNAIKPISPMDEIQMIGKLADLKEAHYKQSLVISAITELLIEEGIFTIAELQARAARLERLDSIDTRSGQGQQ